MKRKTKKSSNTYFVVGGRTRNANSTRVEIARLRAKGRDTGTIAVLLGMKVSTILKIEGSAEK